MEYHSPLGFNFKLKESVTKHDERKSDSWGKSLPNYVSLDLDGCSRKPFPFENNPKSLKRNSYTESPSFNSDHKNMSQSPGEQYRRRGNTSSVSISDYYHPSMVEDPWRKLEHKGPDN